MNNELIKRINAALYDDIDTHEVLRDCRAEIERLLMANEVLKGQNAEYASEVKRLSRPYVPMTEDEMNDVSIYWMLENADVIFRKIEAAVIKRAGLEVVK